MLHEASGHKVEQANDISFTRGLGPSQELEGFRLGRPQIHVPCQVPKRLGREGKLHKSGASVKQSESSESLSSWVLGCGTAATCLSLDLFCFEGGVQGGDTKSMGERGAGTSKGNVLALKSSLTSLHWLLSRIG